MIELIALVPLHEDRHIESGARFEATEHRADVLIGANMARLAEGKASEPNSKSESVDSEWKKKISPAEYLERHPTGPAAGLARSILAKAAETAEPESQTVETVETVVTEPSITE